MGILVYTEQSEGRFKKSAYEAMSYAFDLAQKINSTVTAFVIGKVADDVLKELGKYGATKILNTKQSNLDNFSAQSYATAINTAAEKEGATIVVMASSFSTRGIAPRVAIKMGAGLADGAIELPDTNTGFVVKKSAYSSKAFAYSNVKSDKKVITVTGNVYPVKENSQNVDIENFEVSIPENELKISVKETTIATGKILLPEAERVISGGRGLKGPENWGMVEELAELLEAGTACSKPVSDADWRPHSEHVGQTGIAISPNLYVAIGISGAIQHLAGVSASKTIVVINKDPEAPFFKAADYGVVGDAFEVVPQLIEAVKKFKSVNA